MIGHIRKMTSQLGDMVHYALPMSDESVELNPHIGQKISLKFTGQIQCVACSRKIKKSFNQGYCFPCVQSLAQCDICIVKPELCHFDKGTCREPEWGEKHCMQRHIVYLANTSGLKVGITRYTQIPTRWIDQGAIQAVPVFETSSRLVSGLIEIELAKHVADKTNWRTLLKGEPDAIDMMGRRNELLELSGDALSHLSENLPADKLFNLIETDVVQAINYPVMNYPVKISSHNFDKKPLVEGVLHGIKGQYLIFDTGVINVRKFAGYEVEFEG